MLPLDGHCSLKTVVVFNSILYSILSIKCTLLSYLNMLCVYVIIALGLRIICLENLQKLLPTGGALCLMVQARKL